MHQLGRDFIPDTHILPCIPEAPSRTEGRVTLRTNLRPEDTRLSRSVSRPSPLPALPGVTSYKSDVLCSVVDFPGSIHGNSILSVFQGNNPGVPCDALPYDLRNVPQYTLWGFSLHQA